MEKIFSPGFPALIAPASLKASSCRAVRRTSACFPALIAPASLKGQDLERMPVRALQFSGVNCAGLIEGSKRKTSSGLTA